MRFMPAVAAVLVATVALSGDVSAQAHAITTTAYLGYQTTIPGPMQTEVVNGGTKALIGNVMLARDTRGWYISVAGVRSGLEVAPGCVFKSTDRAFLFEFYRQLVENLGREMQLDCTKGTGPARQKLINLDETPFVMLVGGLQ